MTRSTRPARATRSPRLRRALVASAAALALAVPSVAAAGAAPRATALFDAPTGIVSIGAWIVVADHGSSSLTVLHASNGSLAGDVGHATLGVPAPTSIVATTLLGHRVVFVAGTGGRVAELRLEAAGTSVRATRALVLRPSGCSAKGAAYLALDTHGHLVEACQDGVVTEWRTSTGAPLRRLSAATTGLTDATSLAILGADVAVTNDAHGAAPDGVAQLSLASGHRLRTVTNATDAAYAFDTPSGIATDGTNYWEINSAGDTVDELSGATLRFVATSSTNLTDPGVVLATPSFVWVTSTAASSMVTQFQVVDHELQSPWMMCNTNGPYDFSVPSGLAVHGSSLWVANFGDSLVDQMNASTGALVATYS